MASTEWEVREMAQVQTPRTAQEADALLRQQSLRYEPPVIETLHISNHDHACMPSRDPMRSNADQALIDMLQRKLGALHVHCKTTHDRLAASESELAQVKSDHRQVMERLDGMVDTLMERLTSYQRAYAAERAANEAKIAELEAECERLRTAPPLVAALEANHLLLDKIAALKQRILKGQPIVGGVSARPIVAPLIGALGYKRPPA